MLSASNGTSARCNNPTHFETTATPPMRLQVPETTLVIAGAWNPAILNPTWVIQHGLERDPAKEQVQVALPMGPAAAFQDLRYTIADFHYTARVDALIFQALGDDVANFEQTQRIGARILGQLLHTPITGIGHNFTFMSNNPNPEWLEGFSQSQQDLVDVCPEGWEAAQQTLSSSFAVGPAIVNIQRFFDGHSVGVKFNFHHNVASAAEGVRILSGEVGPGFLANYQVAQEIVQKLYGME